MQANFSAFVMHIRYAIGIFNVLTRGTVREGFEPSVHNPPERVISKLSRNQSRSLQLGAEPTGLEPATRKLASFYPSFLSTLAKYRRLQTATVECSTECSGHLALVTDNEQLC